MEYSEESNELLNHTMYCLIDQYKKRTKGMQSSEYMGFGQKLYILACIALILLIAFLVYATCNGVPINSLTIPSVINIYLGIIVLLILVFVLLESEFLPLWGKNDFDNNKYKRLKIAREILEENGISQEKHITLLIQELISDQEKRKGFNYIASFLEIIKTLLPIMSVLIGYGLGNYDDSERIKLVSFSFTILFIVFFGGCLMMPIIEKISYGKMHFLRKDFINDLRQIRFEKLIEYNKSGEEGAFGCVNPLW